MGMSQLINEASGLLASFAAEKNKVTAAVAAALAALTMDRYYYVDAVLGKDLPVVLAVAIFSALVYVVLSTLVDILYLFIDPRLRDAGGEENT